MDANFNELTESISENVRRQTHRDDLGVSIHAGFPNAAADRQGRALDFNALLIQHPISTYMFRVRGNNHEVRGIYDGDIAVIDRALNPRRGDLIVCWRDGNFVLSTYRGQAGGAIEVWGVITSTIHQLRKGTT